MTTETESLEELVNQAVNFDMRWQEFDRRAAECWRVGIEKRGDVWASKASRMFDAWTTAMLKLKSEMLRTQTYFVDAGKYTAHLEGDATDLNGKTPVITRKEA